MPKKKEHILILGRMHYNFSAIDYLKILVETEKQSVPVSNV